MWPANEVFFNEVRGKGGLDQVAIDPLSSTRLRQPALPRHPVARRVPRLRGLPKAAGDPELVAMPTDQAWLAPPTRLRSGIAADEVRRRAAQESRVAPERGAWRGRGWSTSRTRRCRTPTPPPAPTNVRSCKGNTLTWEAEADLESGLASFVIERDGRALANRARGRVRTHSGGRVFQNLQYSDTPTQPLVPMQFTDTKAEAGKKHVYRVIAVNTVGLKSKPSAEAIPTKP